MRIEKDPKADLKKMYPKVIEFGLIITLFVLTLGFQAFKKFEAKVVESQKVDIKIEVQEIPQTEQVERPHAPARPAIPIESEDEDIPEDATIEQTQINLDDLPPPPPPPSHEESEDDYVFVAYDEPPQPIGGFAAIQSNLRYPEIARKAGVEGKVIIQADIDDRGNVVRTTVIKSLGNNGCDEAAIEAIKKVKWKPAMQRDKPVKVRISIPVVFQLK